MSRLSKRQSARGQEIRRLALESLKVDQSIEELERWASRLTPNQIKTLNYMYKGLKKN